MRFINGFPALNILIVLFLLSLPLKAELNYTETFDGVSVDYSPEVLAIDTVNINGSIYFEPSFKDAVDMAYEPGKPKEFYIKKSIIVPGPEAFNYNKQISAFHVIFGKMSPVFKQEYDRFELGINTNREVAKVRYAGVKRGNHIAVIEILAAYYDNLSNSIVIPKNVKVDIKYDLNKIDTRYIANGLASYDVLNKGSINRWNKKRKINNKSKVDETQTEVNPNWFKIKIDQDGVYKIDADKISSLGANISIDDVKTIKIFGKGGKPLSENVEEALNNEMDEQEIIVNTNGDGSLKNIVFFGKAANGFEYTPKGIYHYINHFSTSNYYLLSWGGEEGKRANAMQTPSGTVENRPTNYVHRIFEEEELVNPYPFGSGRQWLGRSYFTAPFINKLENLDRSGEIFYRITLAHTSNSDGSFEISENGNILGSMFLSDNKAEYTYGKRRRSEFTINASQIAQDSRSNLRFEYFSDSPAGATPFFDAYEIHYPRSFFAVNNEISFFADTNLTGITEYSINNFSGNDIYGYDITDVGNPKLLQNHSLTGGMFKFAVDLEKFQGRQFFVSSSLRSPDIEKTEYRELRNYQYDADAIVITHPDLKNSALAFADYREQNSDLNLEVFTVDHIYNAFAAGVPDVTAIRDFIAWSYHSWNVAPKYVVIWGDGHFDYRNIMFDTKNLVPPYEVLDDTQSFQEIYSYNTEDYFVNVDGVGQDWLIDMGIGRVTVNSDAEGLQVLDKIKHYENNSSNDQWRTNIALIADDSKTDDIDDGDTHTEQSETLASNHIPDDMNIEKLYLVEYKTQILGNGRRKPGLTQDMLSLINNSGALILNWVGHGNPRVWAHEFILEREKTIPEMINYDKLFFLTAATCDYGRFDNPSVNSGAEEMFVSKYGGAIGVFSASRIVFSSSNALLNQQFYDQLFKRDPQTGKYQTLGDAYFNLKDHSNGRNDRKFFLLGDPTMRILIPQNQIEIKSINGITVDQISDPIELKALSEVEIEAEIINPLTGAIDDNFNGTSIFTMRDGDQFIEMIDEDSGDPFDFTEYGGALNRSSFKVENGRIFAEFTIPKDISYTDITGRIFVYAYSDDNDFAKGSYRNFKVNGLSETGISDGNGPEIDIYFDTRNFVAGDIVSANPLLIVDLKDETGINTTGLGIGHKIEAWIDDNPMAVDLTPFFNTSLTDSRQGTAERNIFDLAPGEHRIRVRAWDIFNNFSVEETSFIIDPEDADYRIYDDIVFPNPFTENVTIKFNHNIEPPFNTTLMIYNVNGQLVRELDVRSTTLGSTEVAWDAMDNHGNQVPAGIYIIAIQVDDNQSKGIKKGLKAIYIK